MPSNENGDDQEELLGNYQTGSVQQREEETFPSPAHTLSSPEQLAFNKGDWLVSKSQEWFNLSTHPERFL